MHTSCLDICIMTDLKGIVFFIPNKKKIKKLRYFNFVFYLNKSDIAVKLFVIKCRFISHRVDSHDARRCKHDASDSKKCLN